jgi:glutathione S-transferase
MSHENHRRLWGIGTPRTLRPHWMLAELDLDYQSKPILTRSAGMQEPEFRALSEREKIPLLEDGDLILGESAAIALYLADRYRDGPLLTPEIGSRRRALHDEICFFAMTEMDALLYVLRRHEGLPGVYGSSDTACAAAREYFLRSIGEIERRLFDGRSYLLGDDFQVADLLVKTCFDWATFSEIELPRSLRPYSERLGARPAFNKAMGINFTPEAFAALAKKVD